MSAFRDSLVALTRPHSGESARRKIVIAIDELDRCRPDYAIEVLETIKHFFSVPNVYFILGANLDELTNSVRARYGMGANADLYIQKFIDLTIRLPEKDGRPGGRAHVWQSYLDHLTKQMGLDPKLSDLVGNILSRRCFAEKVSLRAIDRLSTQCALVPIPTGKFDSYYLGYKATIASLLVLKVMEPSFYGKATRDEIALHDILEIFQVEKPPKEWIDEVLYVAWHQLFGIKPEHLERDPPNLFGPFGFDYHEHPISRIAGEYIEKFQVVE